MPSRIATDMGAPRIWIQRMAAHASAKAATLARTAASLHHVRHSKIAVDMVPPLIWTRLMAVTATARVTTQEKLAKCRHHATLPLKMAAMDMAPLTTLTRQTVATALALMTGLETTVGSTFVVSCMSQVGAMVWTGRNFGCM
jgi:hypothetical protein